MRTEIEREGWKVGRAEKAKAEWAGEPMGYGLESKRHQRRRMREERREGTRILFELTSRSDNESC